MAQSIPDKCPQCGEMTSGNTMTTASGNVACKNCGHILNSSPTSKVNVRGSSNKSGY